MSAIDYMPADLGHGQMDDGYGDYLDFCPGSRRYTRGPIKKTCRHCGESNLRWKLVDGKYVLAKGGKVHKCDFIKGYFKNEQSK